jgi:hypothetical protein
MINPWSFVDKKIRRHEEERGLAKLIPPTKAYGSASPTAPHAS